MAPGDGMRPIREYMGDRRVAAALAAVAVLTVGYRLMQYRAAHEVPSDPAIEAPSPAAVPPAPVPAPGVRAPLPLPAPLPAGGPEPAWNWARNPFLSPSASLPQGTAGAAEPGDAADPGDAAEPAVPKLRGTVVGKGDGSAIFRGSRPDGGDQRGPVGGAIGDWTLSKVEPYRVFLRRGKETRVLELYRQ